jgi:pimeloyl-ACP methyl ester carboxylesterase
MRVVDGRLVGHVWVDQWDGGGEDTLILVHGLGANGGVWDKLLPLVERDWRGKCLLPDLRGHGQSDGGSNYSFGTFAADLAGLLPPTGRIGIIGHSLGGALGAFLASGWFGVKIDAVVASSVKTVWSEEELTKFAGIATQPVRWMADASEARERFLRVSGLQGRFGPDDRVVEKGIRYNPGQGYRFSSDPRTIGSTGQQLDILLRAARCPVRFVTGADDAMAPARDLLAYDPQAVVIEGAGHNAHVDQPEAIWREFSKLWASLGAGHDQERKAG